jgi:hypothetical protein
LAKDIGALFLYNVGDLFPSSELVRIYAWHIAETTSLRRDDGSLRNGQRTGDCRPLGIVLFDSRKRNVLITGTQSSHRSQHNSVRQLQFDGCKESFDILIVIGKEEKRRGKV